MKERKIRAAVGRTVEAEFEKCRAKWGGESEPAALEVVERLIAGAVPIDVPDDPPAWAEPDDDGILDYPYMLGAHGGADLVHILDAEAYGGPMCGADGGSNFHIVETSLKRRTVCRACRKAIEGGAFPSYT